MYSVFDKNMWENYNGKEQGLLPAPAYQKKL